MNIDINAIVNTLNSEPNYQEHPIILRRGYRRHLLKIANKFGVESKQFAKCLEKRPVHLHKKPWNRVERVERKEAKKGKK